MLKGGGHRMKDRQMCDAMQRESYGTIAHETLHVKVGCSEDSQGVLCSLALKSQGVSGHH